MLPDLTFDYTCQQHKRNQCLAVSCLVTDAKNLLAARTERLRLLQELVHRWLQPTLSRAERAYVLDTVITLYSNPQLPPPPLEGTAAETWWRERTANTPSRWV